jgi:hypothetical protein
VRASRRQKVSAGLATAAIRRQRVGGRGRNRVCRAPGQRARHAAAVPAHFAYDSSLGGGDGSVRSRVWERRRALGGYRQRGGCDDRRPIARQLRAGRRETDDRVPDATIGRRTRRDRPADVCGSMDGGRREEPLSHAGRRTNRRLSGSLHLRRRRAAVRADGVADVPLREGRRRDGRRAGDGPRRLLPIHRVPVRGACPLRLFRRRI